MSCSSLNKPPFSFFKERELVAREFTKLVALKLKGLVNNFISSENIHSYSHGIGWQTSYPHAVENEGKFKQATAEVVIKFDDYISHNTLILQKNIDDIVSMMQKQFIQNLFKMMSETTEKTGNTVLANDFSSNAEAMLAILEKIEFSVNKEGEVSYPSIFVGNENFNILAELKAQGPEFEAKWDLITKEKTEKALASEAARKAKFVKPEGIS